MRKFSEVDEVNYQGRLINRIETAYQSFVKLMVALLSIVIIVSIFIISNTVRLTVYAKKELIKSFELIGATRLFVKAPFIIEGIFHGLIGALLASLFLTGLLEIASSFILSIIGVKISYSFLLLFGFLGGISILISSIGSSRAISQFIK